MGDRSPYTIHHGLESVSGYRQAYGVCKIGTLVKRVEHVEAIMLLFFLALILQAVIEREVRQKMRASNIDALSIYPEHRLAYHPTTAKIFERFQKFSNYRVVEGNQVIKVYRDEITDLHKEVLSLLGMTEKDYWQKVA